MSRNRILAEQLADKLRPRLVNLFVELLDEELGSDDEPARVPGITPEGYARAVAAVARWHTGSKKGKGKKKPV